MNQEELDFPSAKEMKEKSLRVLEPTREFLARARLFIDTAAKEGEFDTFVRIELNNCNAEEICEELRRCGYDASVGRQEILFGEDFDCIDISWENA